METPDKVEARAACIAATTAAYLAENIDGKEALRRMRMDTDIQWFRCIAIADFRGQEYLCCYDVGGDWCAWDRWGKEILYSGEIADSIEKTIHADLKIAV